MAFSAEINPDRGSDADRVEVELDDGPGRLRIGLIALANDRVIERDLLALRPNEETLLYTSRIAFAEDCTVEALAQTRGSIASAAELLDRRLQLDCVVYGCTSGTAALGVQTVHDSLQRALPGVPCVDPISAARSAFRHLGAKSVAIVGPYIDEVTRRIAEAVETPDLTVAAAIGMGVEESAQISRITPETIYRFAVAADHGQADALFVACTDLRSLDVLAKIEAATGKPVVTSNQALMWSALTAVGAPARSARGGQLMGAGTET